MEMKIETRVLLTAIGSFSAPAVIRGLREMGFSVIGTDIYEKEWVAESAEVDRFYQAPPADEEARYLSFLQELIIKEEISFLVPLIDAEIDILNRNRALLERLGVTLCMSGEAEIRLLRSKLSLTERVSGWLSRPENAAFSGQFRTIPTERASEVDFETVRYPLILKPDDGRSSSGLYRIYQEDQLGFAFSNITDPSKLSDDSLTRYLVQPLLRGNVVTVDVVRDHRGNCLVAAREELLRTANGAGLSVRLFRDPELERFCRELAGELGILGAVNFELIRGEGSGIYYFVECNPRFSGGTAFTVLSGLPLVRDSMRVFLGEELGAQPALREGYMTRKYIECRM